ncbi:MAG: hypothetical protein RIR26_2238 [Pseudomonadota bacterium]
MSLSLNSICRTTAAAVACLALGAGLVQPVSADDTNTPALVNEFANLLVGQFDSSAQSIDNPNYLDVTVQYCPVVLNNLPKALSQGRYLALRQTVSTESNPYRVRIIRVFAGDSSNEVKAASFALKAGTDISDICTKPETDRMVAFEALSPERCTTTLVKQGEEFSGGTPPEGCPSDRMGAVRMTSEVKVSAQSMSTWDRGWDAQGALAWGPAQGPYQFERTETQDVRLAQMAGFFSGRFSNEEQVAADPQNFTPVTYEFCQVDFGDAPQRPATRFMLARQSVTTPARTFNRNRLYEFFRSADGRIAVRTNPFAEAEVANDICSKSLNERRSLPSRILTQRDSCVLNFDWNPVDESFTGGTPEGGCPSTFQGAVKVTIEEVIKDGLIQPWERWFNSQNEQVAGSKVGPYIYKRK